MNKKEFLSFGSLLILLLTLFSSCKMETTFTDKVTISYVSEYGTLDKTEKSVDKGYKLTAEDLPVLKEDGYTFDKWYINKEEAKENTVVNKNIILVAKWNNVPLPEMVTISYVSEFGTLEKTEKVVEKGYVLKAEDLLTLTDKDHTFDKWYINKEEAKPDTVIDKNTILVAKWNNVPLPEMVTISYVTEFGTLEKTEIVVEKGFVLKVNDLPKLNQTGYTFDNWYINNQEILTDTVIDKNTILVAKWQKDTLSQTVTISYVTEFGTLESTEKIVEKGYVLKAEDLPELNDKDHTFDKWYINKVEAKADTVINKNTILVAKWKNIPLTEMVSISYVSEYGTLEQTLKVVEKGYTLKDADLPKLTQNGFTFDNWYINKTKTEATIGVVINEDTVLVGKWNKVLDNTAPNDVTELKASISYGDIVLTWTDPSDSDLFGIEIKYTPTTTTRALTSMEKDSIFVAPGKQKFNFSGFTYGTEYIFTVKTIDSNGNKSVGQNVTITPSNKVEDVLITVNQNSFKKGDEIKITLNCATPDAEIYYILEGKDIINGGGLNPLIPNNQQGHINGQGPINGSNGPSTINKEEKGYLLYNPNDTSKFRFKLNNECKIKAFAIKDEMIKSKVVEKTYTPYVTVTFFDNNQEVFPASKYLVGVEYTLPILTNANKEFDGWLIENNDRQSSFKKKSFENDTKLIAQWKKIDNPITSNLSCPVMLNYPITLTLNETKLDTIKNSGQTLSYQWLKCSTIDGTYTEISGATQSTYTPPTNVPTKSSQSSSVDSSDSLFDSLFPPSGGQVREFTDPYYKCRVTAGSTTETTPPFELVVKSIEQYAEDLVNIINPIAPNLDNPLITYKFNDGPFAGSKMELERSKDGQLKVNLFYINNTEDMTYKVSHEIRDTLRSKLEKTENNVLIDSECFWNGVDSNSKK